MPVCRPKICVCLDCVRMCQKSKPVACFIYQKYLMFISESFTLFSWSGYTYCFSCITVTCCSVKHKYLFSLLLLSCHRVLQCTCVECVHRHVSICSMNRRVCISVVREEINLSANVKSIFLFFLVLQCCLQWTLCTYFRAVYFTYEITDAWMPELITR